MSGDQTGNDLPTSNIELGHRIAQVIKEIGSDKSVQVTGKSAKTLSRYASGTEAPVSVVRSLAEAGGYSLEWLITGEGSARTLARHAMSHVVPVSSDVSTDNLSLLSNEEHKAFALIPRLDVQASAGRGVLATDEDGIGFLAFQADWLARLGVKVEYARVLSAKGDSMEPTIRDGDSLLVDTSITRVMDHAIYVVVYAGMVLVKRVQLMFDGSLTLRSDNKAFEDERVDSTRVDQLHIAGRVMWFGRSI